MNSSCRCRSRRAGRERRDETDLDGLLGLCGGRCGGEGQRRRGSRNDLGSIHVSPPFGLAPCSGAAACRRAVVPRYDRASRCGSSSRQDYAIHGDGGKLAQASAPVRVNHPAASWSAHGQIEDRSQPEARGECHQRRAHPDQQGLQPGPPPGDRRPSALDRADAEKRRAGRGHARRQPPAER